MRLETAQAFRETTTRTVRICEADFPVDELRSSIPACLCVISDVDGPSYRPHGAAMVVDAEGRRWGTLSSGCIEDDVVLHAREALRSGVASKLRYGRGSPFMDLKLPCGGGLEITLLPKPDAAVVAQVQRSLKARCEVTLTLLPTGDLTVDPDAQGLRITLVPRVRLVILGAGPEARALFDMAKASEIDPVLITPDVEATQDTGTAVLQLLGRDWPSEVALDARSAVALFFHDHEREPPLLLYALSSPAFYIGALGSAHARRRREQALRDLGLEQVRIDRMANPFGLVTHAKSPSAIAAGVLAQVMDFARVE